MDILDLLKNPQMSEIAKRYVLIDIDKRSLFLEHIQKPKANSGTSYGIFDEVAIAEILNNHYDELLDIMNNGSLETVSVGNEINGDISLVGNTSKQKFVQLTLAYQAQGKLSNVKDCNIKVSQIKEMSDLSLANFQFAHSISADSQKVSIPTAVLVDFILGGYKAYDLSNPNLQISGYNKDTFFYALKTFAAQQKIKHRFVLPKNSKQFLQDVVDDKYANTSHFNRLRQTDDRNLLDVSINDDLREYVFDGMPADYSTLEKAIYIYIKLCKKLTYDPEFYANNQSGMVARKHEDISRLATISTKETRVVCYEFTQLYAKFLFELGINYEIDGGLNYGEGHANLMFRVDDFIVNADSVTQILGGDLYNAKTNAELEGLQCENANEQTVKLFEDAYDKVYDDIIRKEQTQESDDALFYDFLDMFDSLCEKEQVSIAQKRKIFEKRCKEIHLPTMDKITYMLNLSKAIFEKEKGNQFLATIISKKEIMGFNIKTVPVVIFSFNEESFKTAPDKTQYMMMDNNGNLVEIQQDIIKQNFQLGMFRHISAGVKDRHTIPGVDSVSEVNNVK